MASSSSHAGRDSTSVVLDIGEGNSNPAVQLLQAICRNDRYNIKKLIHGFPGLLKEPITENKETALILVAKQGNKSNFILEKIIKFMRCSMPNEELSCALTCRDSRTGNTALHVAVMLGNVDATWMLVKESPDLAKIFNRNDHLPLHVAATHGHRGLMLFLLEVTRDNLDPNFFETGAMLMRSVIYSRFYDVAQELIQQHPKFAYHPDFSPLQVIAQEPTAFPSGVKLGFWEHMIYTYCWRFFSEVIDIIDCRRFFSKVIDIIVPQLKNIRRAKVLHLQATEFLRCLCKELMRLNPSETSEILNRSLLLAAQYGISEVVEEILKSFPHIINYADYNNQSALHFAVMHRHENVYNVINGLNRESFGFVSTSRNDMNGNNILHLAGYRAQQYQLDLVSGAVLQMQRELQWFQEVERHVLPEQKKQRNGEGMTPLEVFQKEHKDMEVYEGKWMIGMANSCTVATTIIGTIAFAAAITVPGGNKSEGTPIFSGGAAFTIFAISNALALFSSICTLLIFLSILTSRYATIDYLYSLPNRLIMGLLALFFSVTSMIISFSATLYLVFAQNNNWILIPIVALALVPVALFLLLQFPLLLNMMQSTYGHSIFRPFPKTR